MNSYAPKRHPNDLRHSMPRRRRPCNDRGTKNTIGVACTLPDTVQYRLGARRSMHVRPNVQGLGLDESDVRQQFFRNLNYAWLAVNGYLVADLKKVPADRDDLFLDVLRRELAVQWRAQAKAPPLTPEMWSG
eukprot:TRINITY_DN22340_c0_g1_i1.p1 TRINITY_DN22340_c0_g1~~TRINITY_DN22340_c0_g1_i1.p1  ORF type:complete len:132 (-),score=11.02 TRINITY_DN22340_c0_g1_i1:87-482(-)